MLYNDELECAQSTPSPGFDNNPLSSSAEDMLSKDRGRKRSYESERSEISAYRPNKIRRKENIGLPESTAFSFENLGEIEQLSRKELEEKFVSMLAEHKKTSEKLKAVESTCSHYQKMAEELSAKKEATAVQSLDDGPFTFNRCIYRERIGKKVEYVLVAYVRLCADVLGDVLQFAVRRQLSELERVGERFCNVIADRFAVKPFLNPSLGTFFDETIDESKRFSEYYLSAPGVPMSREALRKIGKVSGVSINCRHRFILDAKITDFPPYLRFESINLNIDDREGYARLFELISPLLLQLKPAFVGSRLFLSKFVKNSEFNFVQENLLPFFDCCTHFTFPIDCTPEERSVFLASLLQQPSIERALSVDLSFYRYYHNAAPTHLPIDVISKWLNNPAPSAARSNNKIKGNRRMLRLYLANNIVNMHAMVEHLKKLFEAAQTPVHPFELNISFSNINGWTVEQEQTVLNALSHEQLSISISRDGCYDGFTAKIERSAKK